MKSYRTFELFAKDVGQEILVSNWIVIDQGRMNAFADVTDDHQWIHVDVERAKVDSPFKTTIAHGYLTLSLLAGVLDQNFEIQNVTQIINYGLNKVRFPSPVVAGQRIRFRYTLKEIEAIAPHTAQVTWGVFIEAENAPKPACVAEVLFRYDWTEG